MNELVLLRIAHIVPGVFWAGSAVFLAAFLEPTLQRLGPATQGPVMAAVGRRAGPALTAAGAMTVVFGAILVARTPGHELSELFASNWGWAIGLGVVASVVAVGLGLLQGATAREIARLTPQRTGEAPMPAAMARVADLGDRVKVVGQLDAVFVVIAVTLMACARFLY